MMDQIRCKLSASPSLCRFAYWSLFKNMKNKQIFNQVGFSVTTTSVRCAGCRLVTDNRYLASVNSKQCQTNYGNWLWLWHIDCPSPTPALAFLLKVSWTEMLCTCGPPTNQAGRDGWQRWNCSLWHFWLLCKDQPLHLNPTLGWQFQQTRWAP